MEGMLNYFIPEDGDSSDHLNVVPLPRVEQLKLQHVKKAFPLPGQFHFRFKTAFEGTYVWLDVVNDADAVPDFNGLVISKVARVQRESTTRPAEHVAASAKAPAPKAPDLIQTSPEPPAAKREESAPAAKAFNDDLVGLLADPTPAPPTPNVSAPPTPPPQANPAAQDPFNLFMGAGAAGSAGTSPMRPMSAPMNAPRGPPVGGQGGFGGNPGGFNPMGGGAPRPGVGMGISQMHMGMPHQQQQQQQQQQQNSFQGLQWGGMGGNPQQQQQRNPMQQNPNNRQW